MEPPRLSMTVFASHQEDLSPIFFLFPTLLAAAMEDKLEPHGTGSRTPVLLLEETMVMEPSVTTTPWQSALITLILTLSQSVMISSKLSQPAIRPASPTPKSITPVISTTPPHHTMSVVFQTSRMIS